MFVCDSMQVESKQAHSQNALIFLRGSFQNSNLCSESKRFCDTVFKTGVFLIMSFDMKI